MTRAFGAIVVAVVLSGAGMPAQSPDPKAATAGRKLYATYKCDKCHTINGRGTKKTNGELDSVGAELSVIDIKKWLTNTAEMEAKLKDPPKGTDSMANALKTKGIKPDEIDLLAGYLQTLTKKK
jgi:mono/diheme cytochrome c family protein